jgi:HPt (histidine-containing phosphotransfer) domain-containing protein
VAAVNFEYLEGFVAGDVTIAREVLTLFRQQADGWLGALDGATDSWRATVHTIKGAARGVGANALGDACELAEFGTPAELPKVRQELAAALAEMAAYLAKTGG